MEIKYIVDQNHITVRDYLEKKGFSRNFRKQVRIHDIVYCNGIPVKNHFILHKNDELIIKQKEEMNPLIALNAQPFTILFEDEYFLIIEKPSGISSQPSKKHPDDNLISMIKHYYQDQAISTNIHIVNRLDYATSGIVIVAKSGFVHHQMNKTFILKKYLCVIEGELTAKEGTISLPIKRMNPINIKRMVSDDGQTAITHYRVIEEINGLSLLEVWLDTGRTHQIRVHFSYLNHPLKGDALYGKAEDQLYLHCCFISFVHPYTNQPITLENRPTWEGTYFICPTS
ncbi:MAG: RluA family pseudouridine synthase [Bacilli bacterium]|nr:RluA family pseudouridine synthase [Bacilli bacterium]